MLPVAVARSSNGGVAIAYVLHDLRMTSCFYKMGPMGRIKPATSCLEEFARWRYQLDNYSVWLSSSECDSEREEGWPGEVCFQRLPCLVLSSNAQTPLVRFVCATPLLYYNKPSTNQKVLDRWSTLTAFWKLIRLRVVMLNLTFVLLSPEGRCCVNPLLGLLGLFIVCCCFVHGTVHDLQ